MAVSGLSNGALFRRWTAVLVTLVTGIAGLQLLIAQAKQLGGAQAGPVDTAIATPEAAAEAPQARTASLSAPDQAASAAGASDFPTQKGDSAVADRAPVAPPPSGNGGPEQKASGPSQPVGAAPGSTGGSAYAIDVNTQPAARPEAAAAAPPVQSPHVERRKSVAALAPLPPAIEVPTLPYTTSSSPNVDYQPYTRPPEGLTLHQWLNSRDAYYARRSVWHRPRGHSFLYYFSRIVPKVRFPSPIERSGGNG